MRLLGSTVAAILVAASTSFVAVAASQHATELADDASRHTDKPNNKHTEDGRPFHKGQFSKRQQDGTACPSHGEKQWTGTVDIADDKRLFYWYFDSRRDPENDPIIIWLNGGPGASSLNGLFNEMGPCYLPTDNTSVPNPHSFNNKASVLFIDQPAAVGFSQLKDGTPYVQGDVPAAEDLQVFLRLFFDKVFPSKKKLPIHFTGESYGGSYVTVTMKHILDSRKAGSKDAFWGDIVSLVFINPSLHGLQLTYGHWEIMCTDYRGHKGPRWNQTVCDKVAATTMEGEFLALKCDYTLDGPTCSDMVNADLYSWDVYDDDIRPDGWPRDQHNIDKPCIKNIPFCDPEDRGNITYYINQPRVLKALNFSPSYVWTFANGGASKVFHDNHDADTPVTHSLAAILDAKRNYPLQKEPIRVLLMNGNLDFTCGTPGQKWVFENLRWTGGPAYRAAKWQPWEKLRLGVGQGEWKASANGQFALLGIDGSGHMVPYDQPVVAEKVMEKWMANDLV